MMTILRILESEDPNAIHSVPTGTNKKIDDMVYNIVTGLPEFKVES